MSEAEKGYLAQAGKVITFQLGVRFLTDHLNGDTYFRVHREGQNLDRARVQFKLVEHARKRGSDEGNHRRAWLVGSDERFLRLAKRFG